MKKTNRVGLYIRVSSDKQLEEGFSFEDREEKLVEQTKFEKMYYKKPINNIEKKRTN